MDTDEPEIVEAAKENEKAVSSSSWFSWYNEAKTKTISTLSMVKHDLTELTEAVGQQAVATVDAVVEHAPYVGQAAQDFGAKAGQWVKSVASVVNDAVLQMSDTTSGEELNQVPIVVGAGDGLRASGRSSASFAVAKILAAQTDPNTFLSEPNGAPELFEDFLDHFSLTDKKPEIIELLAKNNVMDRLYKDLVPSKISSSAFWERYFYKVHQIELDQAKIESFIQKSSSSPDMVDRKLEYYQNDSWSDESDVDELTSVLKEKGLYDKPITPTQDHVLDEHTATQVLAMEDERRRGYKTMAVAEATSEPVFLPTTDVSAAYNAAEAASTDGSHCATDTNIVATTSAKRVVEPDGGSDELCSENSFCIVRSGYSSDTTNNGDTANH